MNKHCIEYIYEKKIYYKSNKRTLLLSCRRGHSVTKNRILKINQTAIIRIETSDPVSLTVEHNNLNLYETDYD